MSIWSNIIRDNRFQAKDVAPFENKLFYEGARWRSYLERFSVLLFLATVIATAGILGDSTATVIGAMIVAPLMTPIMATATALIMGNMRRAIYSLLLVASGVVGVVLLSWLSGAVYSGVISFSENTQILARISPRPLDLIAALASGAAGAFCLSRDDIADSLPGVAISISLVPPLCVVGISLSAGELEAAKGALLLFMTNFLSIILAGGGVLALLGLNQAALVKIQGPARRNAFLVVLTATLVIASPLVATGRKITREAIAETQSRRAAEEWVADTNYAVRLVQATDDNVYIAIVGSGEPPAFAELITAVQSAVGRPVVVRLEVVPSQLMSSMQAPP
ncbi:MAG: TIGR00341 family protein [Chloroflexota bacterium]